MLKFSDVDSVILYGAGSVASKIYDIIKKNGKVIDCIIDKNPYKQKNRFDCPILDIDNIGNHSKKKNLVIITLQNANLHCDIANEIYKRGNEYIIFLPMNIYMFNDLKYQMFELYQKIMEDDDLQKLSIPSYGKMLDLGFQNNKGNLHTLNSKYITISVPIEYIFSADVEVENKICNQYYNRNIMAFKPWFELFEYIDGNGEYPQKYLQYLRNTLEEQRELLLDRFKLWKVYEELYYNDFKIFDYMPAYAQWNNLGYFNVIDGHHRLVYLLRKGHSKLPLRILKEDFEHYYSNRKLKCLNDNTKMLRDIIFFLLNWCLEKNRIFENVGIYADGKNVEYFAFNLIKNKIAINVKAYNEQISNEKYDLIICLDKSQIDNKILKKTQGAFYFLGSIEESMKISKVKKIGRYLRNNEINEIVFCYIE